MEIFDISKINSGKEFADIFFNSKCSVIKLTGEKNHPTLKKFYEAELKNKFQIGDTVKLAKDMLDFAGVEDDGKTFVVIGITKVNNQFLYELTPGYLSFFGYELEKL